MGRRGFLGRVALSEGGGDSGLGSSRALVVLIKAIGDLFEFTSTWVFVVETLENHNAHAGPQCLLTLGLCSPLSLSGHGNHWVDH